VTQAEALERAILARAERLAGEFRDRAKRTSDGILREAAEKLRLREQREEAIAKALGDRTFRQQVQAEELRMQSLLDQTRWDLVTRVEAQLTEQMQALMAKETAYLKTLRAFIDTAATEIGHERLHVQANSNDLRLLHAHWSDILEQVGKKSLRLDENPIKTLGGVLVTSNDHRIRVDNTFEGRLARLRLRIQQVIQDRLLHGGFDAGNLFDA
jgi:V/A-type H+-transporting ATPase subunit E